MVPQRLTSGRSADTGRPTGRGSAGRGGHGGVGEVSAAAKLQPAVGPPTRPDIDRILADPDAPDLVFQPIVDLRLGLTAGYEALARFGDDPRNAPDLVFAEADRLGVAAEVEARVLRKAIAARDHLPDRCFLAVNVFPHLLSSPEVESVWRTADLSRLVLELNEAVAIDCSSALAATSQELRDRGAFIAMDDVGSGYAGLRQLTYIRPDFVKLDRSLVTHIDDDQVKIALTELVGGFASRLNGWVIAEGIERVEELTMLVALGVPLAQGFLLGRPSAHWQFLDPSVARRIQTMAARTDRSAHIVSLMEPARVSTGDHGQCARDAACPPCMLDLADVPESPASATETGAVRQPSGDSDRDGNGDRDGAGETTIIVSNRCRPVALQLAGGAGTAGGAGAAGGAAAQAPRRIPTSLFARPDEPVTEVARRAMTRPKGRRFDPVIIVTEMGRPLGLVRMERLMLRLAELSAV
ncbi:diguanylate phosphodiesterase [Frankia sp. CcI49]|uniref:EAL domain-containing protein n=1 Tax=Frankia sp. CcI49 TaxID=1745382 RepID=UPI000977FFBF|nr:EAL domain-containing protein [Frankia sp. CcI49]ONH50838.1 diguanylate phosphodiesterase [Frankia sp. CcI49]